MGRPGNNMGMVRADHNRHNRYAEVRTRHRDGGASSSWCADLGIQQRRPPNRVHQDPNNHFGCSNFLHFLRPDLQHLRDQKRQELPSGPYSSAASGGPSVACFSPGQQRWVLGKQGAALACLGMPTN